MVAPICFCNLSFFTDLFTVFFGRQLLPSGPLFARTSWGRTRAVLRKPICAEMFGVCAEICADMLGVCAEICATQSQIFQGCAPKFAPICLALAPKCAPKAARKTAQCGPIFAPIFAPHTHYEVTENSF